MTLRILYRDDRIVAVHKPSGMYTHRNEWTRPEDSIALQTLRDQLGCYVYPVHRLDRATSGVLLFALDAEMARDLGAMFAERRVQKTYFAVVRGYTADTGEVDHAINDPVRGLQSALTLYMTLARVELSVAVGRYPTARYSLVQLLPRTGRRHQLRRHLRDLNHPIVGDTQHGDRYHNHFFRDELKIPGLLLCAAGLKLEHPFGGEGLRVTTAPDLNWRCALTKCGWSWPGGDALVF